METLVVVDQRRNQYYGGVKNQGPARFGSSPPSRHFREISCRTFQSGAGILPTPSKVSAANPVTESSPPRLGYSSFKTPSPTSKGGAKTWSSPIPIGSKVTKKDVNLDGVVSSWSRTENLSFSELWAGPTYSNSPPPSSLPIPKFSMRPKRTVSLDLPAADSGLEMPPTAKSAPASPTRESNSSMSELFYTADSATKTLRRILNLDVTDE